MANRTILIGSKERFSRASVAIPDKSPLESPSAYELCVTQYLNQRFGSGAWWTEEHTSAAAKDADALLTVRAALRKPDPREGLLQQLTHRGRVKKNKYPK